MKSLTAYQTYNGYGYLSLLFNFKIGPLLGLSCQMSSMFIIILIIHIIGTTFFDNTILMTELEGKFPWSRWSLSAHNFPNSSDFHKILDKLLKKGLVYFYTKYILPPLLHFWINNQSPNVLIISLIRAQAQI